MQFASLAPDEVEETFARFDQNGDRSISFEEFAALMLEIDHARPEPALRASFAAIDQDQDGHVNLDEFRAWCR